MSNIETIDGGQKDVLIMKPNIKNNFWAFLYWVCDFSEMVLQIKDLQ